MRPSSSHIVLFFHVIVWVAVLFFPYFIADPGTGYAIGPLPGSFFTLAGIIHLMLFYTNAYYLFPTFFRPRRRGLYVLLSVVLVGVTLILKMAILQHLYPDIPITSVTSRIVFAPSFGFYVASIVYRNILNNIRWERVQKEAQAERLATELKFLRSQINPHFLFNTLANLVSLARIRSGNLEPALIQLADLMRYTLYEAQDKRVPLSKEITYLYNYIGLQKLRFGDEVVIDIDINTGPAGAEQYLIEPMLLIPFVENAFKHGTGHLEQPESAFG